MNRLKLYGIRDIDKLPQLKSLSEQERFEIKVVSQVLPFRTNNYVVEELINWDDIPNDPIFRLTFMQKEMLSDEQFGAVADALKTEMPKEELQKIVLKIRSELNPHPAGQSDLNIPKVGESPVPGIQHKYKQTCLIFPKGGQTCFAYCTFCFRWAQFVETDEIQFETDQSNLFMNYLKEQKEVTDVLITGGDPMIMSAKKLSLYIKPLLTKEFDHIKNIRIGTKVLSYWPYRFLSDRDTEELINLFKRVSDYGKHLAFMAHFNHPIELKTDAVKEAIQKVRSTGAEIRTQSPILKGINDDSKVWTDMWAEQVRLGCIPYYMFIERDTGARAYFELPLYKTYEIFQKALHNVSGLARTVRGPSMSTTPGKVCIEGITSIQGQKVFVLTYLQNRDSEEVKKPFFAKFDPNATWFNDLEIIQ